MLRIVLPGRVHNMAFTWEDAVYALCIKRTGIVHAPRRKGPMNKPNIYRKYIQL